MISAFPESVKDAFIQRVGVNESMLIKMLSIKAASKGFAELIFDVLMKGLGK